MESLPDIRPNEVGATPDEIPSCRDGSEENKKDGSIIYDGAL